MKIVISDYPNVLKDDLSAMTERINDILPGQEIVIFPYTDEKAFYEKIADADGLITAFLPVNAKTFMYASKLKCVSIHATGYSNVNLEEAEKRNIVICHVGEYCTEEVAEHTIALICALNRNLKAYSYQLEREGNWKYAAFPGGKNLAGQTLAVFGFGKISRRVAELAHGMGMEVIIRSDSMTEQDAESYGVRKVTAEEAFEIADVISNHMSLTEENYHFFNREAFAHMKKCPLFINTGRGGSVDETALLEALERGWIRGAGIDVLEVENPAIDSHPLSKRENVILTPHSAFYSADSVKRLQRSCGENMAYILKGEPEMAAGNILKSRRSRG